MQPRIFQGRQDLWNKDILINILSTTHALQGKFMVFFLLDDFKTTFQIRHLTHRWEQSGYFFLKPGNLFFLECLIMQFFSSLTSDLRDTIPRQRSFTLLSRVMEDFPGGDNHSKHMPPLTYLA